MSTEKKGGSTAGPGGDPGKGPDVPERGSRTIPPPIPRAALTRRGIAVPATTERLPEPVASPLRKRLDSPTALERAQAERKLIDLPARAAGLQADLDASAADDPARAALYAYELGELYETQLRDEDRARESYRRATQLDRSLRAASWSLRRLLYRKHSYAEVKEVIEEELAKAEGAERLDLLIETAATVEQGARDALQAVTALDSGNQVALLQLERIEAARDKGAGLPPIWRRLAEIVTQPDRKLGYALDAAWATRSGFDIAANVASKRDALRVSQERLRSVVAGGSVTDLDEAFDAYERVVLDLLDPRSPTASVMERELVAVCWLRARYLRADRPQDAWIAIHQASAVSHADPLLVVEMIELAAAAGRESEVPALVQLWKSVEDSAARHTIVSRWSALAFGSENERRAEWRALVKATRSTVPGWIVGVAIAECEAIVKPRDAAIREDLAEQYLLAARAAARGTWLGAERGQPDPAAAAMLFIQAAEVFAHYLVEPDVESAHTALEEAVALVPNHPAVVEATIELDDSTGEPQEAIERLRALATDEDQTPTLRALRIARTHGLTKVVFDIERALLERQLDLRLAWEHETTLTQLGRDDERAELLVRIARNETDHQRKYIALLGAARIYSRVGSDTAIDLLRELRALEPQQQFPREALIDTLRRSKMWTELVDERTVELADAGDRARAALQEIAWVQEVCIVDPAAAARAYASWVERFPDDNTALEGLARCSVAIGDTATAVRAREVLFKATGTETSRWLLARDLARAGLVERAVTEYRELTSDEREHVALTAALSLVSIAAKTDDGALRAFGASELAGRTADGRLAGVLYEEVGWFCALTSLEMERAATAFSEAVGRDPTRVGALVGCTLTAAARADGGELARRYTELAETVSPALAVALRLRAAAVALCEGDESFAADQVLAARTTAPDDEQAKFVMVEVEIDRPHTQSDPFSATERMVERANLLAARAELVEDPQLRTAFELDRADILESAGMIYDAGGIVTGVVRAFPQDRRALLALRRLARDADPGTFARASYALSLLARDPKWQQELLRSAATGFGARDDLHGELSVLTRRIVLAAGEAQPNPERLIGLLLERIKLLRRHDERRAVEDLDGVLACARRHPQALRMRIELADLYDNTSTSKSVKPGRVPDDDTAVSSPRRAATPVDRRERELTEPAIPIESDESVSDQSAADYTNVDSLDPFPQNVGNIASPSNIGLADTMTAAPDDPEPPKSSFGDEYDTAALVELARRPIDGIDDALVLDAGQLVGPATKNPLFPENSDVLVVSVDQLPSYEATRRSNEALVESLTREVELATAPAERAVLWTEIGRLCEVLGESERAKAAFTSALAVDPRWPRALRGARRVAYRDHEMADAAALLAREVEVATGRERGALQRLLIDLLLATRENTAAREAIKDLLAKDAADVGVLSASLVAAFVANDAPVIKSAQAALAREAPELEENESPFGKLWQDIWNARAGGDTAASVAATLELAFHVESEDPTVTTAFAMLAQMHATESGTLAPELAEPALEAAKLAARIAAREPLVVRLAAETSLLANESAAAAHAFSQWARTKADPAERAYAAGRAAELEPTRLGRMWSSVVEHLPDNDYAVSKLRAHHVAAGKLDDAIAVDLRSAREGNRLASMIDAVESMIEETRTDEALAALTEAREKWPQSLAAVEAHADALASVGNWTERAKVLDEAASVRGPAVAARDVLRLRAAAAWDLASAEANEARLDQLTISALLSCERVLADNPGSVFAHGTALKLARNVHDRRLLAGVLTRLAAAEPSAWAKSSLGLRRMRVAAVSAPDDAKEIARTAISADDPRLHVGLALAFDAAATGPVSTQLEALAKLCAVAGRTTEAATLLMRAAHVAAEGGDVERALALGTQYATTFPRIVADLLAALRGKRTEAEDLGYTRLMQDADDAARSEDAVAAFAAYRRALVLRPGDAVALVGQALVGARLGKPVQAALEQLEAANAVGDAAAELAALEHLARASDIVGQRSGVIDAVRNAVRLDPSRADLYAWLERELAAAGDRAAIVQSRRDVVARTAKWPTADRVAMLVDTALFALRAGTEEDVLRTCRAVLELEPQHPFALRQVESALRKMAPTLELAHVHERIASLFGDVHEDRTSSAAASTRAGQVYAALGRHADAVAAFARGAATEPQSPTALDGWRASALEGGRGGDLLEIARAREGTGSPSAADFLLAGVALMEGAPHREAMQQAALALRRVLEIEPGNADAFWRLWIVLDTLNRADELVELLRPRLAITTDREEKIDLNRELAERLFVADPTAALQHYRNIVAIDPADVRAYAAIADLASANAPWNAAADAVAARITLEKDPRVLHTLHARLGALYAGHDDAKALDAFQHAAQDIADDPVTLEKIAQVAVRLGQWQVALAASERLVVAERDPAKLAEHFVRSAAIFANGFSNTERANRMLLLALEAAPTNIKALEALVSLLGRTDPTALRHALEQVETRIRRRIEVDPTDGAAYRMLSRTSTARAASGDRAAAVTARAAAEMAGLFGTAEAPETALLAQPVPITRVKFAQAATDAEIIPETLPAALLAMLRTAAPAIQQVAGVDVTAFGVPKKLRLRGTEPLAVSVRAVATALGLGELDVYLAPHPYVTNAEPGEPISLVIGHAIAASEQSIAYAAGAVLGLVQMSLAIPARLPAASVQTLVVALLDLTGVNVGASTPESVSLANLLRRHVSPTAQAELERLVRSLPSHEFPTLVRDLQAIGLRAGFAVSGQLRAGLEQLAGVLSTDVTRIVSESLARDLIGFALSDKAATLLVRQ
ncbi:MAG TPA: hypothetical protein VGM90_30920 [Kofleriaceae bacterium]|jgi:tetratricopeptide (TPR) repeat protein